MFGDGRRIHICTFVMRCLKALIPSNGVVCGAEPITCSHLAEHWRGGARLNFPGAVVQRGLCTELSSTWW